MRYLDKALTQLNPRNLATIREEMEHVGINQTHSATLNALAAAHTLDLRNADPSDEVDAYLDSEQQAQARVVAFTVSGVMSQPWRHILTKPEARAIAAKDVLEGRGWAKTLAEAIRHTTVFDNC